MDKRQAEAAARALLEPAIQRREARARAQRRAVLAQKQARDTAVRRKIALSTLAGGAIGLAVAHVTGMPLAHGAWMGCVLGVLIGRWVAQRW